MDERWFLIVGMIGFIVLLVACEPIPGTGIDGNSGINISEIVKPFLSESSSLKEFSSCSEIVNAFEKARTEGNVGNYFTDGMFMKGGIVAMSAESAVSAAPQSSGRSFSETNIQVEGVDEADIIKTDGNYIYAVANNRLYIAEAYPARKAELLSTTKLKDFNPQELFIQGDRLLLFGTSNHGDIEPRVYDSSAGSAKIAPEMYPSPRYFSTVSVKLYDISDREDPELLRTVEFEGSYLSSRKIGSDVYFVVNSYPDYYGPCKDCIVPLYAEDGADFEPVSRCIDVNYIEPLHATNFITVAAISMTDENRDLEKEVIVGNGQNIYASQEYLYIAQSSYSRQEETVVSKFEMKNGQIKFIGDGDVPGRILNQFSMDEYDGYFRIATTTGDVWNKKSSNNVYILDDDLDVVGELEGLAPGEKIYSVRFMGKRGYVVTFKKIDPLFVIDLSNPKEPEVLGKLKIPGYSDYLHPYDETHLIGIGKDAVDAESEGGRPADFAWYQGIKMAIFDVSDVENPIEMHKEIIGDRGTDSPVLQDHKAFLFDKEKNLLVIPVLLAEIKGDREYGSEYGDYVFQGAYVYDISLNHGFELKGKVSHYDDSEVFRKSGYYFDGDASITRSLYIEDVLYTFSNKRIQLNSLDSLEKLNAIELPKDREEYLYETMAVAVR